MWIAASVATLVGGVWVPRAHAQYIRVASDGPASVEKDRIVIRLPLPYEMQRAPTPPTPGYFVWRVTVSTLQPFSIVVTSDTALKSNASDDVLGASTVRRCGNPMVESARNCTDSLNASLAIAGDHFRLVIKDTALVARVRRERPAIYMRSVIFPGGRYRLTQHGFAY